MTNASLDSTPAEELLEGFPVGCNWKVPRADVEVAEVVVAASVVVVVVVVVVGNVGMGVVGSTVGVVAEGVGRMVESVVGKVGVVAGREGLCPPPRQGAPNCAWQPAPQYASPCPQLPYFRHKRKRCFVSKD